MIPDFCKTVISIIKTAMDKTELVLPENVDLEEIYEYGQQAQILPLLYYGLQDVPGFFDELIGKKFFKSAMHYTNVTWVQMEELEKVCSALDEAGIDYMKLKGSVIKAYYEYPEMRTMGDADILIRLEDREKIKEVCEKIGYFEEAESDHEIIYGTKPKKLSIEFHKWLIPSYNKDFYEYFGIGWDFAKKVEGRNSEYEMSDEDFFVYIFAHFAKHYRDAGVGIKYITDFYLFKKIKPNMDFDYINKAFEKLQIKKFWENIDKLLRVWFEDEESNDVVDHMTVKMFGSYTFGFAAHRFRSIALKDVNAGKSKFWLKIKHIWYLTFLPYRSMKVIYPILEKVPILLPFMWVRRWFSAIFFKRDRIKYNVDNIKAINDKDLEAHHNELTYVGLDYNF